MGGLASPRRLACAAGLAVVLLWALASPGYAARAWRDPIQLSSEGATVEFANIERVGNDGAIVATWFEDETGELRAAFKQRGSSEVTTQTLGNSWWSQSELQASPGGPTVAAWVSWPDNRLEVADFDEDAGRFDDAADMGPAQEASAPAIAANADGDLLLAFVRQSADGAAIWAMRRPRGESWTEARKIVDVASESDWRRQLQVALKRDGDAIYAWSDELGANDQRVRAVVESADGSVGSIQELSTAGRRAWNPRMAIDALGDTVVAWVEVPPDAYEGAVRASVSLPNGLFRPALELLGTAGDWDPVAVGTGSTGNALVTWRDSFAGLRVATGVLATGVFLPGLLLPNDAIGSDPALATDADGNALIVGQGWRTRELRVIRRSALGIPGQARNVSCPAAVDGRPVAATVDDDGNASFVWREIDHEAFHSLFLAQDEPSARFSPDPCPPRRPWLGWEPSAPEPGETVTFDGSGTRDWSAAKAFRYEWDFDDDGTFEVSSGSNPIAEHVFDDEGLHRVRYRVTEIAHRDLEESQQVCAYTVRVGLPHLDLPVEDPPGWDRRPLDLPDESPWPLEPPVDVPPVDVPPVDVPPVELDPVETTQLDPPAAGTPPTDTPPAEVPPTDGPPVEVPPIATTPPETPPVEPPPQFVAPGVDVSEAIRHVVGVPPPARPATGPGLTVQMPARMRRAAAFRRGLTLTLSSGESLRVGVRALVKRRGVLAPAAKLRTPVTPLRSVAAHVLLPRWAKASLVHRKRAQVVIEIRVARDRGATQLLRRGVTLVP